MSPLVLIENYGERFIEGALLTLSLTFIALFIASFIALPMALIRTYSHSIKQTPIRLYISFFRGTPLIGQMFLLYYGVGQFQAELKYLDLWWFFRDPFYCAVLTMGLNSAAYQAEILRGGFQNVPKGEVEAGQAYGMSRITLLRKILLPHCYRIAFPALGNEVILLLKASAIASVVTLYDLMGQTKLIFARTFDFSAYLWAAVMYLVITYTLIVMWQFLEKKLSPHLNESVEINVKKILLPMRKKA